jgi:hypothetical protein
MVEDAFERNPPSKPRTVVVELPHVLRVKGKVPEGQDWRQVSPVRHIVAADKAVDEAKRSVEAIVVEVA